MANKILNVPSKLIGYKNEFSKLQNLVEINSFTLSKYLLRLIFSTKFRGYMDRAKRAAISLNHDDRLGGWIYFVYGAAIYAVIRYKKPDVVVETGVGPGGTSAFILKALEDNGKGVLYSIDLPGNDAIVYPKLGKYFNIHVPQGYEVGWLVPPYLKYRWNLIIGNSKEELPSLMRKVKRVDVFLHDSLHTDEQIIMEFNVVLPYMNAEGILLCDDVNKKWSLAFNVFCARERIPSIVFNDRLGVGMLKRKNI